MKTRLWLLVIALVATGTLAVASPASATLTSTFFGTVYSADAGTPSYKGNTFTTVDTSPISATVTWPNTTASVSLQLKGPSGAVVASSPAVTGGTQSLTYDPTTTGTGAYIMGVKAVSGGQVSYTLVVTHSQSASPPPASVATYRSTIGYSGPAGIYPYGMAYDPTDDSVLVGDYWNYRAQRFTSAGVPVTTLGIKTPNAPNVGAPYGMAVDTTDLDSSGKASFWVAQQEQGRIVQFDHSGNFLQSIGIGGVGTDAAHPGGSYAKGCGNGNMTFPTHIAIDSNPAHATYGDVYVSDVSCKNSVYVFDHTGHFQFAFDWSGYAADAKIYQATPRGLGFGQDGNVYVAELNGKAVVVFTPQGQYLRSWKVPGNYGAGGYGSGLNDVRGIAMDNVKGSIYVVAAYYGCVFEFTQSTGALVHKWCTTGGTTGGVAFDSIRYIAADNSGQVYVSSTWGNPESVNNSSGDSGYRVYKFAVGATSTDPVTPVSWATTSQPPPNGGFNNNNGVAVVTDSVDNSSLGSVFVTDQFENRVQKFDGSQACVSGGNCPAFQASFGSRVSAGSDSPGFDYPKAIAYGDGYVWIGDQDGNAIVVYRPDDASFVHRFGDHGKLPGQFSGGVQGIAVTSDKVFAVDTGNCRLSVFDEQSVLTADTPVPLTYMGACGTGANQMAGPRGVAVSADGSQAWVVNTNSGTISRWNVASGTATILSPTCSGTKLKLPVGAAFDPTHTWLYVADGGRARVVRMAPDGTSCTTVSTGADTPEAVFKSPQYVSFDASGNLFVSDKSRHVYSFTINN